MIATFTFEYNGAIECKRRSASRYNVCYGIKTNRAQWIQTINLKKKTLHKNLRSLVLSGFANFNQII